MKKTIHRLTSTLSLISRFPVPLKTAPDFSRVDFWLPWVGLLSGAAAWAGYEGCFRLFSFLTVPRGTAAVFLPALCAMLLQYMTFNLFHFDGLLDTADALGAPGATPERRLEILKDPRSGSFAVFTGIMVLAAKIVCITSLPSLAFLFLAPVSGRLAAALVPAFCKPAKETGLGSIAKDSSAIRAVSGGMLAIFVVLAMTTATSSLSSPWLNFAFQDLIVQVSRFCSCLTIAIMTAWLTARTYREKMGGFTGDALGFAVETCEVAILVSGLFLPS